jgi:hypothetical protein
MSHLKLIEIHIYWPTNFAVVTALLLQIQVFWDVMLIRRVDLNISKNCSPFPSSSVLWNIRKYLPKQTASPCRRLLSTTISFAVSYWTGRRMRMRRHINEFIRGQPFLVLFLFYHTAPLIRVLLKLIVAHIVEKFSASHLYGTIQFTTSSYMFQHYYPSIFRELA